MASIAWSNGKLSSTPPSTNQLSPGPRLRRRMTAKNSCANAGSSQPGTFSEMLPMSIGGNAPGNDDVDRAANVSAVLCAWSNWFVSPSRAKRNTWRCSTSSTSAGSDTGTSANAPGSRSWSRTARATRAPEPSDPSAPDASSMSFKASLIQRNIRSPDSGGLLNRFVATQAATLGQRPGSLSQPSSFLMSPRSIHRSRSESCDTPWEMAFARKMPLMPPGRGSRHDVDDDPGQHAPIGLGGATRARRRTRAARRRASNASHRDAPRTRATPR